MIQITYQKRNGEIFNRIRNTYFEHRVGDTTSMGWKVLDIKYNYNGRYYNKFDYDRLITIKWNKEKKIYKFKKDLTYFYKNINHLLIFLIIFRIFEQIILKMN